MSEHDGGQADRESPMIYDGGLKTGESEHGTWTLDHRVIITCDSVLSRPSRFTLYLKHGRAPLTMPCPRCGHKATIEYDDDEEPGLTLLARVWEYVTEPFHRGDDERGEQPGV